MSFIINQGLCETKVIAVGLETAQLLKVGLTIAWSNIMVTIFCNLKILYQKGVYLNK